jgi:hypothetical protein
MDSLQELRFKEKILAIKLEAIRAEIALYDDSHTTTALIALEDESPKAITIPAANGSGKEKSNPLTADALLKSILKDKLSPDPLNGKISNLVINEPKDLSKSLTSPVANGAGKDGSNPLIPVALGKSKMTILSRNTNPDVLQEQKFIPDYLKAVQKEKETVYVIYEGPHKGIHTEWAVAKAFVDHDRVTCKKFKSVEQARLSLASYAEKKTLAAFLSPRVARKEQPKKAIAIEIQETIPALSFPEFRTIWNKARSASQEDLLHERFGTDDKKSRSLYTFIEGADLYLVHSAFQVGLTRLVYPSSNLQELNKFPTAIFNAVKHFRKKVLKANDSPIFLKIFSSVPDWAQSEQFNAYHYIELGLSKAQKELPVSQVKEEDCPNDEQLVKIRTNGLRTITDKLMAITELSKLKVNYADKHCLITSWTPALIDHLDYQNVGKFEATFFRNEQDCAAGTKQQWCRIAHGIFKGHNCKWCLTDEGFGSSSTSDSGTPHKDFSGKGKVESDSHSADNNNA